MDIDNELSDALDAMESITVANDTHGIVSSDIISVGNSTGEIDPSFWGGASNDLVFTNPLDSHATIRMGALGISSLNNGDVEIVMDTDGLREEYHINADKVRSFLRSIADVVVEGRET